jgi:ankyrin repeat protein
MCTVISSTVCSPEISFGAVHCRCDANEVDVDFANQDAIPEDGLPFATLRLQKRVLAPDGSPVHKDFVRAAAEGQHPKRLTHLLAQGADIDAKGDLGLTALYNAAFRGSLENVQLLLHFGADVNPLSDLGGTPVCIAALRGHVEVVEALLSHKANLVTGKVVLGSAIHCACFGGVVSVFKSMLDRGATLDHHVVLDIDTLSQLAKRCDALPAVQVKGANSQRESSDRRFISCSPILLLAECCHFELLRLCWVGYKTQPSCSPDDTWHRLAGPSGETLRASKRLRPDSDTSFPSERSWLGFLQPIRTHSTLLMWAAGSLKPDLVDHLLVAGANLSTQDSRGWTALHYAAWPFHGASFENISACVQRLVAGGADAEMRDKMGRTPLTLTVQRGHPALDPRISIRWGSDAHATCVEPFLENTALFDATGGAPDSILLRALHSEIQPGSIELICRRSAALVSIENNGYTPLRQALCLQLDDAIIQILLQHGADANEMNVPPGPRFAKSNTPLTVAVATHASDVSAVDIDHGAISDPGKCSTRSPSRPVETRGNQLLYPAHRVLRFPARGPKARATQVSKMMAWLLRHGAKEGFRFLEGGFLNISEILANRKFRSMEVTFSEVREIVATDEKRRYTMIPGPGADGGSDRPVDFLIRAN